MLMSTFYATVVLNLLLNFFSLKNTHGPKVILHFKGFYKNY
jgi:hypothetical protein